MADESSASVIPLHQVQPPKRKKAEPSAPRAKASRQRKKPAADKAEPPSSEHLIPLDFPDAEAEHALLLSIDWAKRQSAMLVIIWMSSARS